MTSLPRVSAEEKKLRSRLWHRKNYHKRNTVLKIKKKMRRRLLGSFDRETVRSRDRNELLRRKYGIGLTVYETLLASQDGVCAICYRPGVAAPYSWLVVDHEHGTAPPRIRGLLCQGCNMGLGG